MLVASLKGIEVRLLLPDISYMLSGALIAQLVKLYASYSDVHGSKASRGGTFQISESIVLVIIHSLDR